MNTILGNIEAYAAKKHEGQKRKRAGDAYIIHPVDVMKICSDYTQELPVLAAALLHDVLEKTDTNKEELLAYLQTEMNEATARKTLQLVVELTDVYEKKDYPDLSRNQRKLREAERLAETCPETQTIKYADLLANSREIVAYDPDSAPVYLDESNTLLQVMKNGDPGLRKKVQEVVHTAQKEFGASRN